MKGFQTVLVETFLADANVSQFTALVQAATDFHATNPAALNAASCVGVALDDATSGNSVPVVMIGTVWIRASGAITAGNQVIIANATGQVQAVGATSSPNIIGQALSSTTTAGDLCLVKLAIS